MLENLHIKTILILNASPGHTSRGVICITIEN